MKTTYIVFLVIIAAGLGLWYSIDVLSNTTLLIEENGELYRDSYTTAERFFALWPVSIIGGLILAIVIASFVIFTFQASEQSDVEALKEKLEKQISQYKDLKEQCLSDVEKANLLASTAQQDAITKANRGIEREMAQIESEKLRLSEAKTNLNRLEQEINNRSEEIEKTLTDNNELLKHYRQEVKLAQQKVKNHGNALSRKNNMINRLKNDTEYLNSFITENYET